MSEKSNEITAIPELLSELALEGCIFSKEAKLFFKEWKGLRTLAKVTATRTVAGQEPATETRYYIASVEADPKLLLETVRTHWQVENNLHWMLYVAFREDYTRKTDNAAINLSLINKVALTMLKQTKRKEGIASRRKFCGWDENFRDEVLGIKFID